MVMAINEEMSFLMLARLDDYRKYEWISEEFMASDENLRQLLES